MFDRIYNLYARFELVRWLYQIGFLIAWGVWAAMSLQAHEATWVVFGWLPAMFWPVELIAYAVRWLIPYVDLAKLLGFA
jgi:hypothetical protein